MSFMYYQNLPEGLICALNTKALMCTRLVFTIIADRRRYLLCAIMMIHP